jgi:hypothetical protein
MTIPVSLVVTVASCRKDMPVKLDALYPPPLTILSGLPSAGLGALVTLLAFGKDPNLYDFVGIIMLVGIVKKTPT